MGTGLVLSSKSVAKGVIMGVSDVGGDVLAAARKTVKSAVHGASEVGADIGMVASAVDGRDRSRRRDRRQRVPRSGKSAAAGAIDAAGTIQQIRCRPSGRVASVVGGVKEVAGAALLPHASASPNQ